MHEYPLVLALCLLTLGYGLVSKVSERAPFTAPMAFVPTGLLLGPLAEEWKFVSVALSCYQAQSK